MTNIQDLKDYANRSIEKSILDQVHSSILGTVEQKLRSYGVRVPAGAGKDTLEALYDIAVSASHQSNPKSAILNAAAKQGISLALGDDDKDGVINVLDDDSTVGSAVNIISSHITGKLHNINHIEAPVTPGTDGLPPADVEQDGLPADTTSGVEPTPELEPSVEAPVEEVVEEGAEPPVTPKRKSAVRTTSPR